jgi:hypothetical protein
VAVGAVCIAHTIETVDISSHLLLQDRVLLLHHLSLSLQKLLLPV